MMKIKLTKPGYYNCNYPEGAVIEVDDNFGKYVIDMKDAVLADPKDKITDYIPYIMKPKVTGAEDALTTIANALKSVMTNAPAGANPKTEHVNPSELLAKK